MRLQSRLLSTALGLALALPALASEPSSSATAPAASTPTPERRAQIEAELAKTREELARAGREMARLTRELGADTKSTTSAYRFVWHDDQPRIGLVFGSDGGGVHVRGVTPGSGAEEAGVRAGDRILTINGIDVADAEPMDAMEKARRAVAELREGSSVALVIERGGARRTLTVIARKPVPGSMVMPFDVELMTREALAGIPEAAALSTEVLDATREAFASIGMARDTAARRVFAFAPGLNGMSLAPVGPDLGRALGAESGVLVLDQTNERLRPLVAGDVITSVGGTRVENPGEFSRALRALEAGTRTNMEIVRDKRPQVLVVTVPERSQINVLVEPPRPLAPPKPPVPAPAPPAPHSPI